MISPYSAPELFKKDEEKIRAYLKEIKDYQALVIDIRGNSGGDSSYYHDFLLPLILDKEYELDEYSFIRDSFYLKKMRFLGGYKKLNNIKRKSLKFKEETMNYLEDFGYFSKSTRRIIPHQSIKFKGNVYLIVDRMVYSSSEMFASFMKESGYAILVGERTGGDGIGTDPMQIGLPKTGYVMVFPPIMGVTGKGSINDLEKTMPDIVISSEDVKRKVRGNGIDIEDDACVKRIIEEEALAKLNWLTKKYRTFFKDGLLTGTN